MFDGELGRVERRTGKSRGRGGSDATRDEHEAKRGGDRGGDRLPAARSKTLERAWPGNRGWWLRAGDGGKASTRPGAKLRRDDRVGSGAHPSRRAQHPLHRRRELRSSGQEALDVPALPFQLSQAVGEEIGLVRPARWLEAPEPALELPGVE